MRGLSDLLLPLATTAPVDLSLLKNIALVVFFVIFVAIGVRLLLTRREAFDRAANLPLDDETEQTRHG